MRPAARRAVTPVKDQGARLGGGSAVEATLRRVAGSQHHGVTGSQGHGITGSQVTRSLGHTVAGSQSRGVTGSQGHGSQGHRVTGSRGHSVTASQDHRVLLVQVVLVVLVVKLLSCCSWLHLHLYPESQERGHASQRPGPAREVGPGPVGPEGPGAPGPGSGGIEQERVEPELIEIGRYARFGFQQHVEKYRSSFPL